jgi:predicted Fe-Mo cluster-binding NifX family protein
MRLCMPTADEHGLTARLSRHFGRAPYHTLVESGTGDVSVLVTDEMTVSPALQSFREGRACPMSPDAACEGRVAGHIH